MLLAASVLTLLVAAFHSFVGGARLIRPLTRLDGFPVILNSQAQARRTLQAGWHLLSITWVAMAGVMAAMHFRPDMLSPLFLWTISGLFGACGAASLILSRGRHLSWAFFLPIAVLTGLAAA